MKEVTIDTFTQEVLSADTTVIVDFWAAWCGPCRAQAPVLDELAQKLGDTIKIVKVNVDEESALAARYGVQSIPTMIFFKGGEAVNKAVGLHTADQLEKML